MVDDQIKQQRKQKKQETILDLAEQLLSNKPQSLPTVANITQAANMAKGGLYNFFASKEDVFLELLKRYFSQWTKTMAESGQVVPDKLCKFTIEHPLFLHLYSQKYAVLLSAMDAKTIEQYKQWEEGLISECAMSLRTSENLSSDQLAEKLILSLTIMSGAWQQFVSINKQSTEFSADEMEVYRGHATRLLQQIWTVENSKAKGWLRKLMS